MIRRFADFFFLFRPHLSLCGLTFLFLGYFSFQHRLGRYTFFQTLSHESLISIFTFFLALSAVNIINEIVDVKTDKLNSKKLSITQKIISRKQATFFLIIILILITFLSIKYNNKSMFIVLGLGFLYSNPIKSLKGVAPFDLFLNTIGFGYVAFYIGYTLTEPTDPLGVLLLAMPYILLMGGIYLATTIPDINSDKKAKIRTTGVLLGKKTIRIASILIFNSLLFAYILNDKLMIIMNLVTLIYFLKASKQPTKRNIRASFIKPISIITIITAFLYWYFLLITISIMFFVKQYHKKQFGITYP